MTGLEACRRHGVRRGPGSPWSGPPARARGAAAQGRRSSSSSSAPSGCRSPLLRDGVPLTPVLARLPRRGPPPAVGRRDHRADRRHRSATALHAGAPGGRAARGQPARFRHAAAGAGRRRRRMQVDGRARRQASSGAQRPARAVVERGGYEPSSGRLLGIADAWFDEVALAWEINSYAWHLNAAVLRPTRSSAPRGMTAGGRRRCFRCFRRRCTDDPATAPWPTLVAAYAAAARRPRPPVGRSGARERHRCERTRRSVSLTHPTPRSLGFPAGGPQPTDGPRPRDCGVEESGDGCGMPSSSGPNSVISALFQGVTSSATSEFVVRINPATDAPFCSAERTTRSGSMIPSSTMLPKRPSSASKPSSTPMRTPA